MDSARMSAYAKRYESYFKKILVPQLQKTRRTATAVIFNWLYNV